MDQDQWSTMTQIMVHQRNRWIHSGHGFIGCLGVPWSRVILDHWSWSRSAQRNAPVLSIFRSNYFVFCSLFLEWYWRVWMLPSLLRVTAVLLFLLSVTLVWSEVTFFNVKPVLSIFAQMIHSASEGYYYFYVEVCAEKWHVVAWRF